MTTEDLKHRKINQLMQGAIVALDEQWQDQVQTAQDYRRFRSLLHHDQATTVATTGPAKEPSIVDLSGSMFSDLAERDDAHLAGPTQIAAGAKTARSHGAGVSSAAVIAEIHTVFGPDDLLALFAEEDQTSPDAPLGNAIETNPKVMLLVRGCEHQVALVNNAFRAGFHTTNEPGRPIVDVVPRFEQLGLLDALDHVYATGTVYTAPEIRLDGFGPARRPVVLRVVCSPVRNPTLGPVTGVLLCAEDVTDQQVAVDRLRSSERRHRRSADTLQRSLLPQRLPQPDDLRIAGCYLPGAAEIELTDTPRPDEPHEFQVGGDWYDVIPLGAGRTGLVMGDVMGRGVQAAAVMGRLREAVRAYAAANMPPGELLLHLDRHAAKEEGASYAQGSPVADTSDIGALATAVYAVYDPYDHVLTYARAGHLAPLLRQVDGSVVELDAAGGPPLGTGEWTWQEASVSMPPGSYLALYTNGLVERRGSDLDTQIARLRSMFASAPNTPAQHDSSQSGARLSGPVDLVRDQLLGGMNLSADHDDDLALLVVHAPRWQGPRAKLFRSAAVDLIGGTEIAAHARSFASEVLRNWQLDDDLTGKAVQAISELVANAATHGRPPVRLRLRRTDRRLSIDVTDAEDHLPRRRLVDGIDEDGRGIGIVAALASSWGARPLDEGKSVWCEFML